MNSAWQEILSSGSDLKVAGTPAKPDIIPTALLMCACWGLSFIAAAAASSGNPSLQARHERKKHDRFLQDYILQPLPCQDETAAAAAAGCWCPHSFRRMNERVCVYV